MQKERVDAESHQLSMQPWQNAWPHAKVSSTVLFMQMMHVESSGPAASLGVGSILQPPGDLGVSRNTKQLQPTHQSDTTHCSMSPSKGTLPQGTEGASGVAPPLLAVPVAGAALPASRAGNCSLTVA